MWLHCQISLRDVVINTFLGHYKKNSLSLSISLGKKPKNLNSLETKSGIVDLFIFIQILAQILVLCYWINGESKKFEIMKINAEAFQKQKKHCSSAKRLFLEFVSSPFAMSIRDIIWSVVSRKTWREYIRLALDDSHVQRWTIRLPSITNMFHGSFFATGMNNRPINFFMCLLDDIGYFPF
jgi:hypothetical protein